MRSAGCPAPAASSSFFAPSFDAWPGSTPAADRAPRPPTPAIPGPTALRMNLPVLLRRLALPSALLVLSPLRAADPAVTAPPAGVPLPFSESLPLHCESNARDYDLFIRYPDGYREEKNKDRRYPVVYICDAQWDFFLIGAIYPTLIFDEQIEECILVGMAWGGQTRNYWQYRGIDYTPVPMASRNPDGGGAAKFGAALKHEIIPFVEARVRADPCRRILTGSSYGGLFVLHMLLVEPGLFCGYIAPTPALVYADNYLPKQEAATAAHRVAARGRLFLTAGALEGADWRQSILDFEAALNSRHYPELRIRTAIIAGAGHSGQKAEAYARGLQFVLGK